MSTLQHSLSAKALAAFIGIATAFVFTLGAALPNTARALTTEETIAQLLVQIAQLQIQIAALQGGSPSQQVGGLVCTTFSQDLTIGSTGSQVMAVQKFLNSIDGTQLATAGAGSPGNETSYFGTISRAAVSKFQQKYGITPTAGYWGPISRAKANTLCATTPVIPPVGTVPPVLPTGTSLMVTAGPAIANSLAVENAARVPFTNVTLTAGSDGDITVNGLTVKLVGLLDKTAFDDIVLLDSNGLQLGTAKTLNSNYEATIGGTFVVKAGQTMNVTVAANMDSDLNDEAGSVGSFEVRAVNTTASVAGTLPIVGATHTMNGGLAIGSVTTSRGALDPGANQTKEVGITGYNFTSVKITAGSVEDVALRSLRFNQTGSASKDDIGNTNVLVSGTTYPVTTTDGKYYTVLFPGNGFIIAKGTSVDVTLRGDIVSGSARTIDFDIEERVDMHLQGQKYGYGILPPLAATAATADGSAFNNADNPYYDASQVTIDNGTMTVSSWTGIAASNLAENLLNQPLAGFSVDVKGEAISVGGMAFNFLLVESDGGADIGLADVTNVTLFKSDGTVLSGPTDGSGAAKFGSITLSDTVTFPIGVTNIVLKGKLGTDFATNDTIRASTTPSGWTTVRGQTTGRTITPAPSSAVSGPTQTVKAGSLTVTVSTQPAAQTVIAGANQFEFTRYILDASASGENVRLTSLPLEYNTNGTATDLTNCQLWDGATSLTTGSNTKNPTAVSSSTSFTFDGTGLVLTRGTSKTLSLKCNIRTGVTAVYQWGIDGAADDAFTGASGVDSGTTVTEVFNDAIGQAMTAAANGSFTVTSDTGLLFKAAQAGASGVVLGAFKFEAGSTEDIDIKGVAFELGNTASNSPADFAGQSATLYNGATAVGTIQFGLGTNTDYATSTLTTPVRVVAGESVTLTVKADLSVHNSDEGTPGAFLMVSYDGNNNGLNGNYATGVDSGATISGTSADATTNGVRIYRAVPTIADVTTTYNSGLTLSAGSDLYAIRITAPAARDVTLHSMAFDVLATGLASTDNWQLVGPSGAVNATAVSTSTSSNAGTGASDEAVGAQGRRLRINFDAGAADRIVTAGTSKDYRLQASSIQTLSSANTETIAIFLLGDTGINPTKTSGHMAQVSTILGSTTSNGAASTTDRFVWSPNSTTSSSAAAAAELRNDWTNGYGLPGYPGVGQNMAVRVFQH